MRRILLALLLVCSCGVVHAEDYTLGPDSQPQDGVPKGTVTKFTLAPGKDYPGTPHNCAVYVPAQYDAGKPTAFMIFLDGSQALGNSMRVPVVLDNLIAKHDLPPMIAIFVDPGVLPAVSDPSGPQIAQNRYNRIYEYDSLTPLFSDFLLNELIPEVAKQYNLSKNPDDRGLSGVSTGAVGAFAAAWNRPDQFHRVLSLIGTYVAMKGADGLPALVRRTEPKPIRIFMQDGTADHITPPEPFGSSSFGSWPINNQVMYEALEFAGYDVKLAMGTDGHSTKQGGAILPDALRWLWRDYPALITVHEPAAAHEPGYDTSGRVFSTVYMDKPWQQLGGDYGFIASLTSDREGNVFFANSPAGQTYRIDPQARVTQFPGPPRDASILRVGANDRLYTYSSSREAIVSSNTATGVASDEKTIARYLAALNGLEDFLVTANGSIYLLDSTAAMIDVIDAGGHARVALRWTRGEMTAPTRLALSPDQSMLVVIDGDSRYSWCFQIAADGTPANGEPFYRMELPETTVTVPPNGASSATEDTDGEVFFATPLGIQIAMQNGRIAEILNPPIPGGGPLTAITFDQIGDQNWLYVAQDGKLFRRPVKVTGANAWTVMKPPKPTL
ncbi:MAG TPA: alpha/beta hydrolase-fold protein [Terracidiphilus sp.]|jgi:sugar lactone lactonase YvrE